MPKEPLIFLNGNIAEAEDTRISPFDRGFLWGDGIYEVTPCFGRNLYRLQDHVDRLYRSLSYVRIDPPPHRWKWSRKPSDFSQKTRIDWELMQCTGWGIG